MADVKSNAQAVQQAERDMQGPMAEAASLVSLYRYTEDVDSWSVLAHGCLERFVKAVEEYEHLVIKHGRPANSVPAMKPATEA